MAFFSILKLYYLWKMHGYLQFAELLLSPHSLKPRKSIPVLVGTTHRKPECLEMRRMYAQ